MKRHLRDWLVLAVFSGAGGIIFLLPFLQEIYYKTLMEALAIDNTQVGGLMAAFGVTSMLCYFPGGWLADRIPARRAFTVSLLGCSATGLYFSTFPDYRTSLILHAIWGVLITLLFWSAMIRATRRWAGPEEQGRAFGLLETGRGIAELLTSMGLLALFGLLGSTVGSLSMVVALLSLVTGVFGGLAWLVMDDEHDGDPESRETFSLGGVVDILLMPSVWLIALVILCGYCAYWGTFRLTSYATDIFGLSVTLAATISVGKMWGKPLAAFIASLFADRVGIVQTISILFAVLAASFVVFALLPGKSGLLPVMVVNVAVVSLSIFALRGIYFALLEIGDVPVALTGTAAGLISVIAYTPDIFMPLIGGWLIDRFPGPQGYQYFFLATAAICLLGLVATQLIGRRHRQVLSLRDPMRPSVAREE